MKIALIQMISTEDYATNLLTVEKMVEEAVQNQAQMVVLPEFFTQISDCDNKFDIAEEFGSGAIQDWLSKLAWKYSITLVAGTVALKTPAINRYLNSSLVFDSNGKILARYDKIHLFRLNDGNESYNETAYFDSGNNLTTFEVGGFRFGLAICYDLRFPELFRQMGAIDAVILPSAFTETTGKAHWEILSRARAIENQCYFLAVNQGGVHQSGRKTYGHTMAIDPWGSVIDSATIGEKIIYCTISHENISRIRNKLPALNHRVL